MPCQWTARVRNIEVPFEPEIPVRAFECREQTASSADHGSMRAAASLQLHHGLGYDVRSRFLKWICLLRDI